MNLQTGEENKKRNLNRFNEEWFRKRSFKKAWIKNESSTFEKGRFDDEQIRMKMIITWSLSFWNHSQFLIFNYWDDDNITMMCRVRFTLHIHMRCVECMKKSSSSLMIVTEIKVHARFSYSTSVSDRNEEDHFEDCIRLFSRNRKIIFKLVTGKFWDKQSHILQKVGYTYFHLILFFFIELQYESIEKISRKDPTELLHRNANFDVNIESKDENVHSDQLIPIIRIFLWQGRWIDSIL